MCPDPETAVGCKRLLISDDYLESIARANVDLVTEPIKEVTADGVMTTSSDGDQRLHEIDVLVLATGFETIKMCSTLKINGVVLQETNDTVDVGSTVQILPSSNIWAGVSFGFHFLIQRL